MLRTLALLKKALAAISITQGRLHATPGFGSCDAASMPELDIGLPGVVRGLRQVHPRSPSKPGSSRCRRHQTVEWRKFLARDAFAGVEHRREGLGECSAKRGAGSSDSTPSQS
jgi:hypothetical protein